MTHMDTLDEIKQAQSKLVTTPNTTRAIHDFLWFLQELIQGCTPERVTEIHRQAVACDDLMNYSPVGCDFRILSPLVALTHQMIALRKSIDIPVEKS